MMNKSSESSLYLSYMYFIIPFGIKVSKGIK